MAAVEKYCLVFALLCSFAHFGSTSMLELFSSGKDDDVAPITNLCEKNSWDCVPCPTNPVLGRLKGLDCSSRKIMNLGIMLTVSPVVRKVDFSNNQITNLTFNTFSKMDMVDVLNLGHNQIETIQDYTFASQKFPRLKVLQLRENALTEIGAYTFFGLDSVEYLDLGENRIRTLAPEAFEVMSRLSRLVLRGNPLGNILNRLEFPTDALKGLTNLRHLHLEGTGLSTLPESVIQGTKLVHLDISDNAFLEVPNLKPVASTLRELDIGGNPMLTLEVTSFAGLNQLQTLTINRMPRLRVIKENTFRNMTQLKSLSIASNRKLRVIVKNAFGTEFSSKQLNRLILRQNALSTIDEHLVEWDLVDVVDLQDNLWRCDCHLRWMVNLKLPKNLAGDLKCFQPYTNRGKRITPLKPNNFRCFFWTQKKVTGGAEMFLAVILIVSLCMIVARFCKNKPLSLSPCAPWCQKAAMSVKRTIPGAPPVAGYSRVARTSLSLEAEERVELEWDDKDLTGSSKMLRRVDLDDVDNE